MDLNLGILAAMFVIGLLAGFVGGTGPGLTLAVLTVLFRVPIHMAVGTTLTSTIFTAAAGALSHLRERNIDLLLGLGMGLSGVVGAYLGAGLAASTSSSDLRFLAGLMLIISAGLIYLRTRVIRSALLTPSRSPEGPGRRKALVSSGVGLVGGTITAYLGVGVVALLQVGILSLLPITLRYAVGTTALALVFISLSGATRFLQSGLIDFLLLLNIILGTATGAYIGAKFTRRVPGQLLRWVLVVLPILTGASMIISK